MKFVFWEIIFKGIRNVTIMVFIFSSIFYFLCNLVWKIQCLCILKLVYTILLNNAYKHEKSVLLIVTEKGELDSIDPDVQFQ